MLKKILPALLLMFSVVLFTGCAPDRGQTQGDENTIVVAGSTTVTPVMRALADAFTAANSDITIEVQELGTSAGINATIQGVSNIAMSSRTMSDAEIEQGITPIAIAIDGVAVVVHPSNPVRNLTLNQITAIFRGDITNWNEVGGNNDPITVVSREEGSGIRQTFESFASVQDEIEVGSNIIMASAVANSALISQGTGGVIASVSGNPNAIGYVTTGVVADGLSSVSVNGVAFSETAVLDGDYIFANTFFIGIMENTSDAAQQFVDFILSESGQNVISDTGYVRIQ